MKSYMKEAIITFVEDVSRGVTSSATSILFDVTERADNFLEEKPQLFTQQ